MNASVRRFSAFFSFWLIFFLTATLAHAAPVLMISIDGLKPEYITQADAHGMKIPYLRTLLTNGTYADGVVGIWPTITYPSHVTLLTGVWPDQHGITNTLEFDPCRSSGVRGTGMRRGFACLRCGRWRTRRPCALPAWVGP